MRALRKQNAYPDSPELFCTSPLERCRDSLTAIYPLKEQYIIDDFKEIDFGIFENKTADELRDLPDFINWMNGKIKAPPDGESGAVFMHRVCAAFEKLVNKMMKDGTTSAVVMAHGGVIMTLLAAYGIPEVRFYDWFCESGHGYSVRITPGIWMRSYKFEVFDTIPPRSPDYENREYTIEEISREAADRIWGESYSESETAYDN